MNVLRPEKDIFEMFCGPNLAFVLADRELFLATEYKVLRGQTQTGLVRCVKMLYNGRLKLYYLTEGLEMLASAASSFSENRFRALVLNLFSSVNAVKQNSFLSCQSICPSPERIYVDPATCGIRLVYLPLDRRLFASEAIFEMKLRTGLAGLMAGIPTAASPKWKEFAQALADEKLSWAEIEDRLKRSAAGQAASADRILKLTAVNGATDSVLWISEDDAVIGKKAGASALVIPGNKMISRRHCRISRRNGQFAVRDLGSTNGTFVNGVRLRPGEERRLETGDRLCLADSAFRVNIQ